METIGLAITVGVLCIFSFIVGAIVGQKVSNQEKIKLPSMNPVKVVNDIKDSIEQKKEIERNKIISENIDNYDGTGFGQKDIP